jgi:hypothetical protein
MTSRELDRIEADRKSCEQLEATYTQKEPITNEELAFMHKPVLEVIPELEAFIPTAVLQGLKDYALHRQPTGSFCRAVLENDFMQAVCRADAESANALVYIAKYIYNALPSTCHGSPQKVKEWLGEE